MTKLDKLKAKLLQKPKDFTFQELETLLFGLGFEEKKTAKTAGSRKCFVHPKTKSIIRIHKPHPSPTLKTYVVIGILEILTKEGYL